MLKLNLAVGMSGWGLPFDKALVAAARLGVAAVEIDARRDLRPEELGETGLRQVRKLLSDAQLRVAAIQFRSRQGYATQDNLDARVEATKRAMQMAYSLGTNLVVGSVGAIPQKEDSDEWRLLIEVLGDLGRYGYRVGATFVTQTESDNLPLLRRLLEALDDSLLGVALNPGLLVLAGVSPPTAVQTLGGAVRHVYLSDAVAGGRATGLVPFGKGDVDAPDLLSALELVDYRGYLTLCESDRSPRPVAEWTAAIEHLRQL